MLVQACWETSLSIVSKCCIHICKCDLLIYKLGSVFSDESDKTQETLAGKNIQDLSEKFPIWEVQVVKTRPKIFFLGLVFSVFFLFPHSLVSITEDYILTGIKKALVFMSVRSYHKTGHQGISQEEFRGRSDGLGRNSTPSTRSRPHSAG